MTSKQSTILGVVAAIVLIGAVASLVRGPGRAQTSTQLWFYDLNTRQLFAAPADAVPPIAAPSGPLPNGSPAGVRAYVFGCGSCAASERYIGYLETFTPRARAELEAAHQRSPIDTMLPPASYAGILVRLPAGSEWFEHESAAGQEVLATAYSNRCFAGVFPQRCEP